MEKFAVAKASSIDLAVEKALQELGVSRDRVEVEVLAKGGLFQKAEVKVTVIETAASLAEDFVNGILEKWVWFPARRRLKRTARSPLR